MSITAEIREWVVQRFVDGLQEEHELLVMCDRIDARADKSEGFCKRLEGAAKERADITILGVDYIALPVDADGVPIHIGDMMETERFGVVEVEGFIHNAIAFNVYDPQPARICTVPANQCRRHHAPTVEDVLSEMLDAVDDDRYEQDRIIAEYAAKLRLAESE